MELEALERKGKKSLPLHMKRRKGVNSRGPSVFTQASLGKERMKNSHG